MRRTGVLIAAVAVLWAGACGQRAPGIWFQGDLEAARSAAEDAGTLVMLEFYTDESAWCRRLHEDTFSVDEVREEISKLVALRVNAKGDGAELVRRFGVDTYPTLVFLDSAGSEVDRILGFLPPDKFLMRVNRIRTGDTFLVCLRQLQEDPGDADAIRRSVAGLLKRSDPEGAIARIEAFHQATEGREQTLCRDLMFTARVDLHQRVYVLAAKVYRRGWDRTFEVPNTKGTASLHALIERELTDLPVDEQASLFREARYKDAGELLSMLDSTFPDEQLLMVADFAYQNGHYDTAADLYLNWFRVKGADAGGVTLNDVAWRLYLSKKELGSAKKIARRAFAKKETPEVTDTLARLLYVTGSVDKAIALEQRATGLSKGARAEEYREVTEKMIAGEPLDDRPPFEHYPDKRRSR